VAALISGTTGARVLANIGAATANKTIIKPANFI